jgi:hypothetical protein
LLAADARRPTNEVTLHEFPVIAKQIGELPGVHFAASMPKPTSTRSPSSTSTRRRRRTGCTWRWPLIERFRQIPEEERADFRGQLTDGVRLHAFLAQVLTFADADLDELYVFARHLRRLLPADREALPRQVQQNLDMGRTASSRRGAGRSRSSTGPACSSPRAPRAPTARRARSRRRFHASSPS